MFLLGRVEGRTHGLGTKGEKSDRLLTTTTSPELWTSGREGIPQGGHLWQMQGDICSLCRRGCVKDDTGVRPPLVEATRCVWNATSGNGATRGTQHYSHHMSGGVRLQ